MTPHYEDDILSGDDAESRSDQGKSNPHPDIHLIEDNLEVSAGTYTAEENKSLVRKLDWHVSIVFYFGKLDKESCTDQTRMADHAVHLVVLPIQLPGP